MPLDESQTLFRWAGGKKRMLNHLRWHLPEDVSDRVYREPFLGAGSMFLEVQPTQAVLSDLNEGLIETFRHVRDRPDLVSRALRRHVRADSAEHYYVVRDEYNAATRYSASQAARFIYLNRTCFNGIFRVNKKGAFNVPYGKLASPLFPSAGHLRELSASLAEASLQAVDYLEALQTAEEGDFVYLDPPYPPLNGTAFFQHYTPDRFSAEDQTALAGQFRRLAEVGCAAMMSNADTKEIRSLYSDFNVVELPVTRFVSCKNTKTAVSELVITNYS